MRPEQIESTDIENLLETLYSLYGYDFRMYAQQSVVRRVGNLVSKERLVSVKELTTLVKKDEAVADALLRSLSINVTEMFRDPRFYACIRDKVLPDLSSNTHIKIWHAGCASGEEAYSMAIMLHEMGIYAKSKLYATDFNRTVLKKAEVGIIPLNAMRKNIENYQKYGGNSDFVDYYNTQYDAAIIESFLKKNTIFSHHDLVTGVTIGDMHMIICRNVLIYFRKELQERAVGMFAQSLQKGGYLCLGSHETLRAGEHADSFEVVCREHQIYRKVR